MNEKIRVLFIGEMNSSHAQSWVRLITPFPQEFEVRALNLSSSANWENPPIPVAWPIMEPHGTDAADKPPILDMFAHEWRHYIPQERLLNIRLSRDAQKIIDAFCPHVIHTFGFFPSAVFYAYVIENAQAQWHTKWVLQTRGGSDFSVAYTEPYWRDCYKRIVPLANAVICDNERNFSILDEIKVTAKRHPILSIAPGTGGMDTMRESPLPLKKRERLILWPKAYDSDFAKCLPTLEGLRVALERIAPARIIAYSPAREVSDTIASFSKELRDCFELRAHIPRDEYLEMYHDARVMLAPALVDGIPNVLYESMITGLVPIVSPLETLTPHFEDGKQVLYARNLYPNEIAEALIKAMNDDTLAERIVRYNAEHFPFFARRPDIQQKVRELYQDLAGKIDPSCTELGRAKAQLLYTQTELANIQTELANTQTELADAQRILSLPAIHAQRAIWKRLKFWE